MKLLSFKLCALFATLAIFGFHTLALSLQDGKPEERHANDPEVLNVHIVAHTHDDVGWLSTVDQYYYGTGNSRVSVKKILDSVVKSLLANPNRRFIYVESAFFFKWWDQQMDDVKEQVKMLVNEGRLEFIGGAWSMNDEATTHYNSIVDQFTWGLRRLNDTFGQSGRPRIGWQIDPFGHSREMASLFAQMGYDGVFMARIDFQDKDKRLQRHNGEMVWRGSSNLGAKSNLFTGVLFNHYSPPPGFCFDILCRDPELDDESIGVMVRRLLRFFDEAKQFYRTNNILITMGDDFHYQDAERWFRNLDKLINYTNSHDLGVNVFYSTPSRYVEAVHASGVSFPTKSDDFFPYASDKDSFWTGYFTSRPTLKRFERIGNHFLQVCKQLTALTDEKSAHGEANLDNLREAMGVMQHHDAVTGTEQQHVASDYARLLQIGIDKCSGNVRHALNEFSTKNTKAKFEYVSCADLNISSCAISEKSDKFMVTLYNSLAQSTSQYVRVPVPESQAAYEVRDYQNVLVESQLVSIPEQVQALFYRQSIAKSELVFLATDIPPVGYKSYFVQKKSSSRVDDRKTASATDGNEGSFTIGNQNMELNFEKGLLASIKSAGVETKIKQNFHLYYGFAERDSRASGAYVFRPESSNASDIVDQAKVSVIKGDLVDEVHQTFNEWISQVIRLYKKENYVELQWMVGPIPDEDRKGREIISRFDTDIQSQGMFYTDSNGREMLKRTRNHRDTWNVRLTQKAAGNYYPITAKIAIEDGSRRLAILTDRAQGGSSLSDGSIEIMVHRRLHRDDGLGVGEDLNERAYGKGLIARGSHYLLFASKKNSANASPEATERSLQLKTLLPPWLLFSDVSALSADDWKNSFNHKFQGMSNSLPPNVHLLTLEPWKSNSILVRFEHILEKNEDEELSKPATFNIKDVFGGLEVASMRETTLSANQWLDEATRLEFKTEAVASDETAPSTGSASVGKSRISRYVKIEDLPITLNPMEIRTFVVELKADSSVQ